MTRQSAAGSDHLRLLLDLIEDLFSRMNSDLCNSSSYLARVQSHEDYFDEELIQVHESLVKLFLDQIPLLIGNQVAFDDLPQIARDSDIIDFSRDLEIEFPKFKELVHISERCDAEDVNWYPLYDALRMHFTVERIDSIKGAVEFKYAYEGLRQTDAEFFDYMQAEDFTDFIPQLEALSRNHLASQEEIEEIANMIARYDGSAFIYVPPEIIFSGTTGGLERDFMEWLEKHLTSSIFDDDIDFSEMGSDSNLEPLKERWLRRPENEPVGIANFVWHTIAVNAPVEFTDDSRLVSFSIHKVTQMADPAIGPDFSRPTNPQNLFKITLIRTGERHEYNQELDKSLLALQCLVVSQNMKCGVESIDAEIDWLRLDEREFPIKGLNERELDDLSRLYVEAQ